jgi:uncharacterized protein YegL
MKYILLVILPIFFLALLLSGSVSLPGDEGEIDPSKLEVYKITEEGVAASPGTDKDSLKLKTAKGVKVTPPPSAPQPSASPTCKNKKIAIDMLLDVSASMSQDNKFISLKQALISFQPNLKPEYLLGVQYFSTYPGEILPVSNYNPSSYVQMVNSLRLLEFTRMRTAFIFTKSILDAAKSQYPDHEWSLIFLSDGKPTGLDGQDTSTENPTDIANQLKSQGIRIITIALGSDADTNLLRNLASSPNDFYHSSTSELSAAFQSIGQDICQ